MENPRNYFPRIFLNNLEYNTNNQIINNMFLNRQQTIELIIKNKKRKAFDFKYKFTTKYPWNCLACGCRIYVSYKQYGTNSIFCSTHYTMFAKKPTIAQYQYMRILKEKQIELIKNNVKDDKNN